MPPTPQIIEQATPLVKARKQDEYISSPPSPSRSEASARKM
jgi:hypothetical protein